MKFNKRSIFTVVILGGIAYYLYRQNKALTSPGLIGGNKLPLGDISAAASTQAAVSQFIDATKTRMAQQEEMLAQDKKIYEQLNPGHSYEQDMLGGISFQ